MTAWAVVTQLNTQEVVVWEPYSTHCLFICRRVCGRMSVFVYMCAMWIYDEYKVLLTALSVCMFVHFLTCM